MKKIFLGFYVSVTSFRALLVVCSVTKIFQTPARNFLPSPFTIFWQKLTINCTTIPLVRLLLHAKRSGTDFCSISGQILITFNKCQSKSFLIPVCFIRFSFESGSDILMHLWLSTLVGSRGSMHSFENANNLPSQAHSWADALNARYSACAVGTVTTCSFSDL